MKQRMPLLFVLMALLAVPVWAQESAAKQDKEPKRKEKKAGAQAQESDQLFQRDKVWAINLVVTPEEWKKIEPANAGGPGFGPAGKPTPACCWHWRQR